MINKFEVLKQYVKDHHGDQKRRYTDEPYYVHLESVCDKVKHLDKDRNRYIREIAYCHDLFEDTNCKFEYLYFFMLKIGYTKENAYKVCKHTLELTDVYTKEAYPHYNREQRKGFECLRLSQISYISQTVKYADIIDNCVSIREYDANFYKVYRKECLWLLDVMDKGQKDLRLKALQVLNFYEL